jgi:hypothetical protein
MYRQLLPRQMQAAKALTYSFSPAVPSAPAPHHSDCFSLIIYLFSTILKKQITTHLNSPRLCFTPRRQAANSSFSSDA